MQTSKRENSGIPDGRQESEEAKSFGSKTADGFGRKNASGTGNSKGSPGHLPLLPRETAKRDAVADKPDARAEGAESAAPLLREESGVSPEERGSPVSDNVTESAISREGEDGGSRDPLQNPSVIPETGKEEG